MNLEPGVRELLGHPLTLDLPPHTIDWFDSRWIFPYRRKPAEPILIHQRSVPALTDVTIEVSFEGLVMALAVDRCGVSAEIGETRIRLDFGERIEVVLDGDGNAALHLLAFAMTEILRGDGLVSLHASVAIRNGVCSAILAPSGTGKSTTLLSAVMAGAKAIAEDSVWLDPDTLQIYCWDRDLRLWQASYDRFKAVLPNLPLRSPDGKYLIPFAAMGWSHRDHVKLERIVLLSRDLSKPSEWSTPGELQAIKVLWESSGIPVRERSRAVAEKGIEKLLRSTKLSGLCIGNTPIDFDRMFS